MGIENSAQLGALTLTDYPNVPLDSPYPYNRMETHIRVDVRGGSATIARGVRLEIVDDLSALIDGLTEFAKRERSALSWCTSVEAVELDLRWNSSLDIQCRVRIGAVRTDVNEDTVLRRDDWVEVYEITSVVVLPDIGAFLEGLRSIALYYPQY